MHLSVREMKKESDEISGLILNRTHVSADTGPADVFCGRSMAVRICFNIPEEKQHARE